MLWCALRGVVEGVGEEGGGGSAKDEDRFR